MKHLLSVNDLSPGEITDIFRKTDRLKKRTNAALKNRTLAMLFSKPSTRTRVSFEVAMTQLGGHAIYLDFRGSQAGRGETLADTARTLSRYADGIMARLFAHGDILEIARHSGVPVINGLTDLLHPCQAIADLYTVRERFRKLKGLKLVFLGDGSSNVTHSLMHICSKLGVDVTVSCPRNHLPDIGVTKETIENCRKHGSDFRIVSSPREAAKDADILYTDTWISMGREDEEAQRIRVFSPYQLDSELLGLAKKGCIVMHCLPAHRGYEITSEVMDGRNSVIFDQAENRLHTEKAILVSLMK
jgi:ornithine carbamoyltransferase